jgi:hypothetical protein
MLNIQSVYDFYQFRCSVLGELGARQEQLTHVLWDTIPCERLQCFARNKNVIQNLLERGFFSHTIYYVNSAEPDSFRNKRSVLREFRALQKAWKNAVDIRFHDPVKSKIGITIRIPEWCASRGQ